MSKRIIYQCDRCSNNLECEFIPPDWVEITAKSYLDQPRSLNKQTCKKLWCAGCWRDVSARLPEVTA